METYWKNRIVSTGERPAGDFLANIKNWRIHPTNQRNALKGILNDVGWVTGVIVNKTTGNVIDGHARIEEALKFGEEVPVPYIEVELSQEEEEKVLATFDPLSSMAVPDKEQLGDLLDSISFDEPALNDLMEDLAAASGLLEPTSYAPVTNPDASRVNVTNDQIEATRKELAEKFDKERALVEVMCPTCGTEFGIDKGMLKIKE